MYIYTIESVLPVCDKPYQMNNGFQQMWAEIKYLWNHALANSLVIFHSGHCNKLHFIIMLLLIPGEPAGVEEGVALPERRHGPHVPDV